MNHCHRWQNWKKIGVKCVAWTEGSRGMFNGKLLSYVCIMDLNGVRRFISCLSNILYSEIFFSEAYGFCIS